MSRDAIFRGKRIDNGEWIYGGIDIQDYPVIFDHDCIAHSAYDVDPETVGQYSGIKDIVGERIFDGDKVKGPTSEKLAVVEYRDGAYMIGQLRLCAMVVERYQLSVIGNIHE